MFFSKSKKRKQDAFAERERRQNVWRFVRRIIDVNTPTNLPENVSDRTWERSNRCLPVALIPIQDEEIEASQLIFAVSKDFSDEGASLITSQAIEKTDCLCGFWIDGPKLLSGTIKRVRPFGGGYYEIGIAFQDVVESIEASYHLDDQLQKLAPEAAAHPVGDSHAEISG